MSANSVRWSMEAEEPAELAALDDALREAGALCVEEPRATTADEPKRPRRGVLQALVNAAEPLPVFRSPGRVEVANTATAVDEAVQHVYNVGCPAVGFDVEWPVSFVAGAKPKPVALVQLALPTMPPLCYLLHIARTGITPALRWLLEDENVVKAGVASNQDAQKIMRDFGIACEGIVDLSDMANRVLLPPMRWSLAALVARVLKRTLPKPTGIRIGSWDAPVLTGEQVRYAAQDAFGSLMLWQELSNMPHLPEPTRAAPVALEPAAPVSNPPADAHGTAHVVFVPAVPAPAVLQPTKAKTLRLHASGLDVSQIAAARGLKDITVQNYIADAIMSGHSHCWSLLCVSPAVIDLIESAIAAAPPAAGPVPGEDADTALRNRMKVLKAFLPEAVTFSQLRLVLAHRERLAMAAPQEQTTPPV